MVPNYNLNLVNRCILTLLGKYYDLKLFLKKIMNDERRILLWLLCFLDTKQSTSVPLKNIKN